MFCLAEGLPTDRGEIVMSDPPHPDIEYRISGGSPYLYIVRGERPVSQSPGLLLRGSHFFELGEIIQQEIAEALATRTSERAHPQLSNGSNLVVPPNAVAPNREAASADCQNLGFVRCDSHEEATKELRSHTGPCLFCSTTRAFHRTGGSCVRS
jgi:hypothetical protein